MKALRWTAVASGAAVFVMIVLGAVVRSTASGLSCPDWPTCYGQWILTPDQFYAIPNTGYTYGQMMLEWSHRAFAAFVIGPLFLVLAWLCWRSRPVLPRGRTYAVVLLVLLLIQAKLGGVTVFDANSPWSVALHLGFALLILAWLVLIVERTVPPEAAHPPAGLRILAVAVWVTALCAMLAAAMTAKSGASLACSTWPLCDGYVIPPLDDIGVRLHFAHRVLAGLTALGLLALFLLVRRAPGVEPRIRRLATVAFVLVVCQVAMGALVIVLLVPIWSGVAHQALGIGTFIALTASMWRILPPRGSGQDVLAGEDGHDRRLQQA
ncbi:COX15/CtaA family protein [Marinivivus vitaminiproducens]|uniref:COX15/CtaA family protein n=1 Tax=Marinivivus vitaminiproducens TaxID=3035935 RepID=UPI00279C1601|nr:COX15/CtaA family protein [Geminicoccaceae bacterium SCSIO 64248]